MRGVGLTYLRKIWVWWYNSLLCVMFIAATDLLLFVYLTVILLLHASLMDRWLVFLFAGYWNMAHVFESDPQKAIITQLVHTVAKPVSRRGTSYETATTFKSFLDVYIYAFIRFISGLETHI